MHIEKGRFKPKLAALLAIPVLALGTGCDPFSNLRDQPKPGDPPIGLKNGVATVAITGTTPQERIRQLIDNIYDYSHGRDPATEKNSCTITSILQPQMTLQEPKSSNDITIVTKEHCVPRDPNTKERRKIPTIKLDTKIIAEKPTDGIIVINNPDGKWMKKIGEMCEVVGLSDYKASNQSTSPPKLEAKIVYVSTCTF